MKPFTGVLLAGTLSLGVLASSRLVRPPAASPPAAGARAASVRTAARQPVAAGRGASGPATTPGRALRIEDVRQMGWGSGPGELGHERPEEASASGPMSFVVDRQGAVFVLDQVNARVAVFEPGKAPHEFALPTDTYQDIALDPRGGLVLLDRLVTRAVLFLDAQGKTRHQIPLERPEVPDGGMVTALFAQPDGVWVEQEHAGLVRVALPDGTPDTRTTLAPGRPAPGGTFVRAMLRDPRRAELARVAPSGAMASLARLEFEADVRQLSGLEVDDQGRLYVTASLFEETLTPPYRARDVGEQVIVLSPQGVELGRAVFPPGEGPDEQLRQIRLGDDGALYHLALSSQGATLRRISL